MTGSTPESGTRPGDARQGRSLPRGPIAYMASNHVAANILMLVFLIGGLIIGGSIKQEVFPEFDLETIEVSVVYPGATPEEIEDAIIRPIELATSSVEDVKRVQSTALENVGTVALELLEDANSDKVLQEVKAEVDRIRTFPEEAERPVVTKLTNRRQAMTLILYGDMSERALRQQAQRVKDDLLAKPNISQVEIAAARPYEISIAIPEAELRKYNLTLDQVAAIIRQASLDLAGGSIKAQGGEVLIRTTEKRTTGAQFDSVAVFTHPNGKRVLLGDITQVNDGFQEQDQDVLFNGHPALMINVYRVANQTPKGISETVRAYIDERMAEAPDTWNLTVYRDRAEVLIQRINLLVENGTLGLVLVIIILALFLEIRLAMWVALGIAISFLGAFVFLPGLGITINMISLFAFITILGIVVDDAIVVGENIYVHMRMGKPLLQAAIDGAREVKLAVTFAALTTVAAFTVLLFLGGFVGKFMGSVPRIVIAVLAISLIESFFILPSHLSGGLVASQAPIWAKLEKRRRFFDRFVRWMRERLYAGTLAWTQRNRYTTVALGIAVLLVSVGLFMGGLIKFVFMPEIEADEVKVSLQMPPGTPFELTREIAESIMADGVALMESYDAKRNDGRSNLKHTFVLLGQQVMEGGPHGGGTTFGDNLAQLRILLQDPDARTVSTAEFASAWRKRVGEIAGVERLAFQADLIRSGTGLDISLSHADYNVLREAVIRVEEALRSYESVAEVTDSHSEGKREFKLTLRPEAASLGITERDLASQIRAAFYGAEALRIQRGPDEVKVMVRYPLEERRSMAAIENMRIRTRTGAQIPLIQAADIEDGRGFSTIKRIDRRRVITISAQIDKDRASPTEIIGELRQGILPELMADYPGLTFDLEGRSRDEQESMAGMTTAFGFGLLIIYGLLAIPFRSFMQPLVVMSAIPFGLVGAMVGHLLLGYDISMISLFGLVALTGVVVNDSLVMIDFINRARAEGRLLHEAILESGQRRFRPIIMTSLTTFFGLVPMILETSLQARFLVPMAISLGFGVLFSTGITLILVPSLYLIQEDIVRVLKHGGTQLAREVLPVGNPAGKQEDSLPRRS